MRTLMDKINHFESLPSQTVKEFNEIFSAKLIGVDPSLEVEIGELTITDTTRILLVGTLKIEHNFTRSSESERKDYEKQQREDKGE